MSKKSEILRVLAILSVLIFSSAYAGEEETEIWQLLQEGDPVKISNAFCKYEYQLRGVLALVPVTGSTTAFDMARREWGWNACMPNNHFRGYNFKSVMGVYIRSLEGPLVVGGQHSWVIQVELEGKQVFTYLTFIDLLLLREERMRNKSAAIAP